MRTKGNHLQHLMPAALLLAGFACAGASASEIKGLRLQAGVTGTRAELQLDASASYKLIRLSNPERLVVDFAGSHFTRGLALPAATGVVKAVRTGQPTPGVARVVFDLDGRVQAIPSAIEANAGGYQLVLEWPGDGPATAAAQLPTAEPAVVASVPADKPALTPAPAAVADPIGEIARRTETVASASPVAVMRTTASQATATQATTAATAPEQKAPVVPPKLPAQSDARGPLRTLVVAIDAGHGGQDPGAIGAKGTREKDVTLAIARELARQVNATPGMKAFLTRSSDMFIPLGQRARRANAEDADIFLSIHADAAENRNAKGSSVYVLSTRGASSQRARWLADKENAADIIGGERVRAGGNTLTSVLLDLTQSGNMKASEDAAGHVLGGLKRIGNNHKPNVEHANFAVLRTSDKMPAMLVETAFISNPDEEQRLLDPGHQRNLARAILDGIDTYFSRQPPPGTLYALRAQSQQTASLDIETSSP